jgi:ATP-dependent helicase/nuclease subunit B
LQTLQLPLAPGHGAAQIWPRIAALASAWMAERRIDARDAVVLLPFAQHLPLARRAWMAHGGWPPRLETTRTLALSLAPEPLPEAGDLSFDMATDQLSAAALLQGQRWAADWRQRDPRGFQLGVTRLVEAAHAWARTAAQHAPASRADLWDRARAALAAGGPGEMERALARVALEWAAATAAAPVTDALFGLGTPGLVLVQAGGPDALSLAVAQAAEAAGSAVLLIDTDFALDGVFNEHAPLGRLELALCTDFEDEAQSTAAAVIAHVNRGQAPVALIAQDRMLLRRVRALLERAGVALSDETGWTLSTLPSATQLMALLRASRHAASLDDWLDWLKTDLARQLDGGYTASSVQQLEAKCRSKGWSRVEAVQADQLSPGAARIWAKALEVIEPLQGSSRRPLSAWLGALGGVLQSMQAWNALADALAGPDVIAALSLQQDAWPGSAQEAAQRNSQMSQTDFIAWVDQTLESHQFVPPPGAQLPQVHITPLVRAMLRPFAAVVLPGADAQTLGAVSATGGAAALIGETAAQELGLPSLVQRRDAQLRAFAQLLRAPALTLLRRRSNGAEPLSPSPLLERLEQALQAGRHAPIAAWEDARVAVDIALRPTPRSAAQAAGRLPQALSATAVESLRNCPYQFFARVLLGLRESDELGDEVDKRDYGTWLHGVLYDFHRWRIEQPGADEAALMQQAAEAQMRALGLDAAAFLPFSSSFQRFVPRYLDWLRAHEAQGAMWAEGELDREILPLAWSGGLLADIKLRGRLDRIDLLRSADGQELLMVDYKTGGVKGLKDKVAEPLEDTQLAVYAALMDAQPLAGDAMDRPMRAIYLALDDAKRIEEVEHPEPLLSAEVMLEGLGDDLLAIHGGQALPALGEGAVCEHCEMRGLCRRDDWALDGL